MTDSSDQQALFRDIEHALVSAESIHARREHLYVLMDEYSGEIVTDALFDLLIMARLRLRAHTLDQGDRS